MVTRVRTSVGIFCFFSLFFSVSVSVFFCISSSSWKCPVLLISFCHDSGSYLYRGLSAYQSQRWLQFFRHACGADLETKFRHCLGSHIPYSCDPSYHWLWGLLSYGRWIWDLWHGTAILCACHAQTNLHKSWLRGTHTKNWPPCPARGSNPGPLDQKSDTLPLSYVPHIMEWPLAGWVKSYWNKVNKTLQTQHEAWCWLVLLLGCSCGVYLFEASQKYQALFRIIVVNNLSTNFNTVSVLQR